VCSSDLYEAGPIVESTNLLINIIERLGIPKVEMPRLYNTDSVTSESFKTYIKSLHDALIICSRNIDEIMVGANNVIEMYNEQLNEIQPLIDKLKTNVDDKIVLLRKVANYSPRGFLHLFAKYGHMPIPMDLFVAYGVPIVLREVLETSSTGFALEKFARLYHLHHGLFIA
jgi:hypothetical protein